MIQIQQNANIGNEILATADFDIADLRLNLTTYHKIFLKRYETNTAIEINEKKDFISLSIKGVLKDEKNHRQIDYLSNYQSDQFLGDHNVSDLSFGGNGLITEASPRHNFNHESN